MGLFGTIYCSKKSFKPLVEQYYNEEIVPVLFKYEFLK